MYWFSRDIIKIYHDFFQRYHSYVDLKYHLYKDDNNDYEDLDGANLRQQFYLYDRSFIIISKYEDINITRLIFTIKWYLADHYIPHSGACRNENDRYDDKGSGSGNSLLSCKQSCDVTQGCGAVSWSGNLCFMTSEMASTTSEREWTCYSKGYSWPYTQIFQNSSYPILEANITIMTSIFIIQ